VTADIYRLLADRVPGGARVQQVVIGLNWTVAAVADENGNCATGLCYSPVNVTRTLPWSGTLAGRQVEEFIPWQIRWNGVEAAVATAILNAAINLAEDLSRQSLALENQSPGHLRVFHHFFNTPGLVAAQARIAVIGHYPGIEQVSGERTPTIIERNPQPGDLPDSAAEYVLPAMDWVFVTASSLANKTLPRLLELAASARVVLMGPSLPWLPEWRRFGVDYLAGVVVNDRDALFSVAAEAGGTRIFDGPVSYRLLALTEN